MKKRKAVQVGLADEERNMYKSFSNAAAAISHLYSMSLSQNKSAYAQGQRDALVRRRFAKLCLPFSFCWRYCSPLRKRAIFSLFMVSLLLSSG